MHTSDSVHAGASESGGYIPTPGSGFAVVKTPFGEFPTRWGLTIITSGLITLKSRVITIYKAVYRYNNSIYN